MTTRKFAPPPTKFGAPGGVQAKAAPARPAVLPPPPTKFGGWAPLQASPERLQGAVQCTKKRSATSKKKNDVPAQQSSSVTTVTIDPVKEQNKIEYARRRAINMLAADLNVNDKQSDDHMKRVIASEMVKVCKRVLKDVKGAVVSAGLHIKIKNMNVENSQKNSFFEIEDERRKKNAYSNSLQEVQAGILLSNLEPQLLIFSANIAGCDSASGAKANIIRSAAYHLGTTSTLSGIATIFVAGSYHAEQNILERLVEMKNANELGKFDSCIIVGSKKPCVRCHPVLKVSSFLISDGFEILFEDSTGMNVDEKKIAQVDLDVGGYKENLGLINANKSLFGVGVNNERNWKATGLIELQSYRHQSLKKIL